MMKDIFAKLASSKCENCQHCISRSCSTAVQSTKQFWIGVLYKVQCSCRLAVSISAISEKN